MPMTLKPIAKSSGLFVATLSYGRNDKRQLFRPETRERSNLLPSQIAEFAGPSLAAADRPTALVLYGMRAAQQGVVAAARLGRRIGQDLSLIAFHNQPLDVGQAITTALITDYQMGVEAVRLLLDKIAVPQRAFQSRSLEFFWGRMFPAPRCRRISIAVGRFSE